MSRKSVCMLAGLTLAAAVSGAALAQERSGRDSLLGEPVGNGPVDKVVTIDANTRWVNAEQDQTVKFIAGGREFTWHFGPNKFAVNLKDIAPAGTVDRNIYVYLSPDLSYSSGS